MNNSTVVTRPRKAAYSVAETAALCGISRARFYDHIRSGVMPPPVYCVRTRRPLYLADLAALCVRVRETNVGWDGRYVLFYDRQPLPAPLAKPSAASSDRNGRKAAPVPDPLTQEMVETLRAMGMGAGDGDVLAAIGRQCPAGVSEATFEADLRAVFDALRCREQV